MAEPRSPAGRAAAAAAREPTAPETGPVPGATAVGAAGAAVPPGSDAADLNAGEADAARIAERNDPARAVRAASFPEAAAAFVDREVPLLDGGPGVGAARVAERIPERFATRPIGTLGEEIARVEIVQPRVPPVTKEVLPRSEFRVDPDTVPGHRYATAATQLRRNGLTYQPGVPVAVDFRGYAQLVAVGAIVADPWHDLDHAPDPDAPDVRSEFAPKI